MKKIISLLLSLIIALSCTVTGFAAEAAPAPDKTEYDGNPVVLIRGMDFNGLVYKYGTKEAENAFSGVEAADIIKVLGKGLGESLIHFNLSYAVDEIVDYLNVIFGHMACNKDGTSKYDVGVDEYPESVANYPELWNKAEWNEFGIVKASVERYGAENFYFFNYDWRIDPFINASKINDLINTALEDTGKEKVNLICCSMGGILTYTYIYKYGYSKLNRVVFDSSTFCGTHATEDVLRGMIKIDSYALYRYAKENVATDKKAVGKLWDVLYRIKAFDAVSGLADRLVPKLIDKVYSGFIRDTFGTMPALWALTQNEYLDDAIDYMFGDKKNDYPELMGLIEEYRRMNAERETLLKKAEQDGVSICVVASYNRSSVPVYPGGGYNGDGTLEADRMLGNAKVAPLGKTLEGAAGKRVSPDKMVDLSTVLFPESTWAVNGSPHVSGSYGTEFAEFLFTLLDSEGRVTVDTYEQYPQFMNSSSAQELRKP